MFVKVIQIPMISTDQLDINREDNLFDFVNFVFVKE